MGKEKPAKVIFLDRDGVINEYPGDFLYVTSWEEFRFLPGSIEAIRNLKCHNFKIFVVSNQADVAKGLYSKRVLDDMTNRMLEALRKEGAEPEGVFYCTHHPDDNCSCRKPKTGLLERAVHTLGQKPDLCFFIGDSFKDMKAATDFGCIPILVLSGREKLEKKHAWEFEPGHIFFDLKTAAEYICSHYD